MVPLELELVVWPSKYIKVICQVFVYRILVCVKTIGRDAGYLICGGLPALHPD